MNLVKGNTTMFKLMAQTAIVAALASGAHAATLDFEGYDAGTILTGFDVDSITGTISATGGSGDAMIFDSNNFTGGDRDLAAPFYAELTGTRRPTGRLSRGPRR